CRRAGTCHTSYTLRRTPVAACACNASECKEQFLTEGFSFQRSLEHTAPKLPPQPPHLSQTHRAQDFQQPITPGSSQVRYPLHPPAYVQAREGKRSCFPIHTFAMKVGLQCYRECKIQ